MKPKYSRLREETLYGSSVNNVYIIKNTLWETKQVKFGDKQN